MMVALSTATAADMPAPTARWRVASRLQLEWRDWGEDSVVFEPRSGATFQFAPLAAAVMACFECGPHSFEMLLAGLAEDLSSEPDDALCQAVAASVAQFLKLGWIEPITTA